MIQDTGTNTSEKTSNGTGHTGKDVREKAFTKDTETNGRENDQ